MEILHCAILLAVLVQGEFHTCSSKDAETSISNYTTIKGNRNPWNVASRNFVDNVR